jgi:hypothetical protein
VKHFSLRRLSQSQWVIVAMILGAAVGFSSAFTYPEDAA